MLLRGTEQAQAAKVTAIGAGFLAAVVVAGAAGYALDPLGDEPTDRIELVIDTPYVGPGVVDGTALVLHGLAVGRVTDVTSVPGGGVRLQADLDQSRIVGLTDTFGIDFRPANYFGVTAINLRPAPGGAPVRDGLVIDRAPAGNYTMQTLLSRLGTVSGGALTTQLISVVDKATRYTDGLTPLIETLLLAANATAKVQTVPTEQLMTNAASLSDGFAPFLEGALSATEGIVKTGVATMGEDEYVNGIVGTLDVAATSLFGAVGVLLRSHDSDLTPATQIVASLADAVPALLGGANIGPSAAELRTRLQNLFAGTPDQRALQVRVVLDQLPQLAGPLALLGGLDPGTESSR